MVGSRTSRFQALLIAALLMGSCADATANGGGTSPASGNGLEASPDCAAAPLRARGPVYYYCDCGTGAEPGCVAGNDSSPGTSRSAPRRTFSNARSRFSGMAAGGTVALCRGGAWNEGGGYVNNGNCRASGESTYCDFRDYVPSWGSASSARPRINAGGSLAFGLSSGGGYRFWNIDIRGVPSVDDGKFQFNGGAHDIDVCNVQIDTMRLGFNINQTAGTRIVIRNSQFYRSSFCAIYGGAPGILIDGNYFEDNGTTATPQTHSVYLAEYADGIRFVNNDIRTASWCGGVQVVLHMILPNAVIENNRISSPGTNVNCYGIQTSFSMAAMARFENAILRRNRVISAPGFGGNSMEIKGCVNCTVSDNILVNGSFTVGTGSCGANVACTSGTTVQNNSVIGTMGIGGTNNIVENNAVTGACNIGGTTVRSGSNVCNVSAASAWVDGAGGNFTPADPGPLIGAASQNSYSPTAVGSVTWSPTDTGLARVPPIHAGAMQR